MMNHQALGRVLKHKVSVQRGHQSAQKSRPAKPSKRLDLSDPYDFILMATQAVLAIIMFPRLTLVKLVHPKGVNNDLRLVP